MGSLKLRVRHLPDLVVGVMQPKSYLTAKITGYIREKQNKCLHKQ